MFQLNRSSVTNKAFRKESEQYLQDITRKQANVRRNSTKTDNEDLNSAVIRKHVNPLSIHGTNSDKNKGVDKHTCSSTIFADKPTQGSF